MGQRGEERGGNKKGGKRRETQKLVHNPMSEILKKNPGRRTALIGGGGNTHVCFGRLTPSRRHWVMSSEIVKSLQKTFLKI